MKVVTKHCCCHVIAASKFVSFFLGGGDAKEIAMDKEVVSKAAQTSRLHTHKYALKKEHLHTYTIMYTVQQRGFPSPLALLG